MSYMCKLRIKSKQTSCKEVRLDVVWGKCVRMANPNPTRLFLMVLITRETLYYKWVIVELTHKSLIKDIRFKVIQSHGS